LPVARLIGRVVFKLPPISSDRLDCLAGPRGRAPRRLAPDAHRWCCAAGVPRIFRVCSATASGTASRRQDGDQNFSGRLRGRSLL